MDDIPERWNLAALTVSGALTYGELLYFGARSTFNEVVGLFIRRKSPETVSA